MWRTKTSQDGTHGKERSAMGKTLGGDWHHGWGNTLSQRSIVVYVWKLIHILVMTFCTHTHTHQKKGTVWNRRYWKHMGVNSYTNSHQPFRIIFFHEIPRLYLPFVYHVMSSQFQPKEQRVWGMFSRRHTGILTLTMRLPLKIGLWLPWKFFHLPTKLIFCFFAEDFFATF